MEQFIDVLERVENTSPPESELLADLRLSAQMRESWRSGRFWFNYAIRKSFELDAIYWALLHDGRESMSPLDYETRGEMERHIETKMKQLKAYKQECTTRFSSES